MDSRLDLEALFPNLRNAVFLITSEPDEAYNCIAHAAGISDIPWWPAAEGTPDVYWPSAVVREETLEAFEAAYAVIGYMPCDGPDLEPGFEKIALFADARGNPTHAARQLSSGAWTSKLGQLDDIEHATLEALEGDLYGK